MEDELAARRAEQAPLPADGEPKITMFMDDERIVFCDEAALDEYINEARYEALGEVLEDLADFNWWQRPEDLRGAVTRIIANLRDGGDE